MRAPYCARAFEAYLFAPVVKKVSSSVVNIYTTKTVRADPRLYRLFEDPVFRKFFGDTYGLDQVPRDVGGSGIGSDIAVQEYGALGCQITRNIFSEVGYRLLYDDFRDTNFLYQLSLHGAQITVGINF